jgi:hypothetical protein
MSVADRLGLGPSRRLVLDPDGSGTVFVRPPAWVGDYPERSVTLTSDQLPGYFRWREGELIQRALPGLSDADKRLLMDGGVS